LSKRSARAEDPKFSKPLSVVVQIYDTAGNSLAQEFGVPVMPNTARTPCNLTLPEKLKK
jgi:hypothetical protein